MFGINEIGKSCSILVTDFKPFFYVKVNEEWNKKSSDDLLYYLNDKLNKSKFKKRLFNIL